MASRTIAVTLAAITVALAGLPATAAPKPGALDDFFSGNGTQTAFANGATAYAVAVDAKGRILVAGSSFDGRPNFALARFTPSGAPDTTFGGDGRVETNLGGSDYAFAMTLQRDGKILVAGERDTAKGADVALVRYTANGRLDDRFGGGDGKVFTDFGRRFQGANDVAVRKDGRIVIGGFTSNGSTGRWALARYGPKGKLDDTFGGDGRVTVDLSASNEQIHHIAIVDGQVVAAGYAEVSLQPQFAIARFRSNGRLEKRFGTSDGWTLTDVSTGGDTGYGLAVQPNGKLVVVGYADNGGKGDWGIVRYGPKGKLDGTFSGNGILVVPFGPGYEFAYDAAVQPNGRIVVVGRGFLKGTGDDFGVIRLKPGGGLDLGFGGEGRVFTDFYGKSDTARAVALQDNGKIVVVGEATHKRIRRFGVARYVG